MAIQKRARSSAGFSLLEVMVSAGLLALVMTGLVRVSSGLSKAAPRATLDDQASYLQEAAQAQISKFLSTYLFWMSNAPNGCSWAGWYFYGMDPKAGGGANTYLNKDLMAHLAPGDHSLSFLLDTAPGGSSKNALSSWYAKTPKTDPTAAAIKRCVENTTEILRPKASLYNKSQFEFCLLIEDSRGPAMRKSLANQDPAPNGFSFVHVSARLYDTTKENDITCLDSNMLDNINRGILSRMQFYSVSNSNEKDANQVRSVSNVTFFTGKQPRMLINCWNLQNKLDPVFKYVCGG